MDNNDQSSEKRKGVDIGRSLINAFNTLKDPQGLVTNQLPAPLQKTVGIFKGLFSGPFAGVGVSFGLIIFLIIFILLFTSGGAGPFGLGGGDPGQTNTPGQIGGKPAGTCPGTTNNFDPATCQYLNPAIDLFDTNISQAALDSYVEKYNQIFVDAGKGDRNEFIRRVNYIVDASKQAGLNPALFLGYWKSESRFGTVSARELGCVGNSFEEQVDCAVGINRGSDQTGYPIPNCARSHDANSPACQTLKAIRTGTPGKNDFAYPISYPISTFDDFAEAHGSFSDDPDGRKGNCTSTYNVLLEVAKELGVCRASGGPPTAGDIPPLPSDIRQGIIDSFGITMNGFDQDHLQWAWEKLWETSNTNFPTLVRGAVLQATSGISSQIGCPGSGGTSIQLGQYTPEDFFKFIITHELGHLIQSCQPRSVSHYNESVNAYGTEGGISFYGNNATVCFPDGSVANDREDYADVIAYYLNPAAGFSSAPRSCGGPTSPPNPFFSGQTAFPLHFSVGQETLGGSLSI